mgnify:CR=1 FL=1
MGEADALVKLRFILFCFVTFLSVYHVFITLLDGLPLGWMGWNKYASTGTDVLAVCKLNAAPPVLSKVGPLNILKNVYCLVVAWRLCVVSAFFRILCVSTFVLIASVELHSVVISWWQTLRLKREASFDDAVVAPLTTTLAH